MIVTIQNPLEIAIQDDQIYFREQRAKQPRLRGYLATAARVSALWVRIPRSSAALYV